MTAVARLSVNQFPLLIGDLLLSSEESPRQHDVYVPSVGLHTVAFPRGSGYTITGLRQKLALIGSNLAIGWTGHRIAAQCVIEEMVAENRRNSFTLSTLFSYLNSRPNEGINHDFALVGWLIEGERVRGFGFRSTIEFTSETFGRVGLLGTGAEDLQDYLTAYPDIPLWNVPHPWQAFSMGLLLTGFLLRSEMKNLSSLHQYYGGGYEIIGMDQGLFVKLDNVTFAFWEATLIGKKVTFTLQPRILKYSYRDDVLLIRSLIFSQAVQSSLDLVANSRVDAVPPIYRNITNEEADGHQPPMNSQILCNYFLIKLPNGIRQVFSRVHHISDEREPLLSFHEDGAQVQVTLSASQFSEICEEIGQHIDDVAGGRIVVRPI